MLEVSGETWMHGRSKERESEGLGVLAGSMGLLSKGEHGGLPFCWTL